MEAQVLQARHTHDPESIRHEASEFAPQREAPWYQHRFLLAEPGCLGPYEGSIAVNDRQRRLVMGMQHVVLSYFFGMSTNPAAPPRHYAELTGLYRAIHCANCGRHPDEKVYSRVNGQGFRFQYPVRVAATADLERIPQMHSRGMSACT